jgi:hypothetical protein
MPVSGAAKVYHSDLLRAADVKQFGSTWAAWQHNLLWPFRTPNFRYIALGLVGPWALLLVAGLVRPARAALGLVIRLWPLAFGAAAAWLFYGTEFWGDFSRTAWYFPPHALLAAVTLAALDGALTRLRGLRLAGGVTAAIGVAWLLAVLSPELALGFAAAGVVALVLSRVRPGRPAPSWVFGAALLLGVIGVLAARGLGNKTLVIAALLTLFIAMVAASRGTRAAGMSLAGVMLAALVTVQHGAYVYSEVRAGPVGWNYNLYRGALWAREHLPLDATIWSGSAGILGYFSNRPTINTDGLANSYEFLEQVLRPNKLHEYAQQWGYAIDATPDEGLKQVFPNGRFLPLPPELARRYMQFADGRLTRSLHVFQMNAGGQPWPPPTQFALLTPEAREYPAGAQLPLRWTATNVYPGARLSLCYDRDAEWNDNEQWIEVDTVPARPGPGAYTWDTRGVPPGTYYVGGQLYDAHDGQEQWTRARNAEPITLR